jgi:quinoprotein glucose dehydrogenase
MRCAQGLSIGVSFWISFTAWSQTATKDVEWPTHGADLAATRYRPLDQINASNFSKLEVAWRFKTDSLGNRPEYKLEGTPLMVGGVVYATAGTRRAVVALDAATGEMLWVHGEREGARGANAPRQLSGRGLAYWSDGKEQRILYVTPGYRLVALDARTGARTPSFGMNGVVDLKVDAVYGSGTPIDLENGEIGFQSAPVVAKDTVIVGSAMREGGTPKTMNNTKGLVRGFDVRTGKRLWIFRTIPSKGEFGYDSWLDGSAEHTGNTGMWTQLSGRPPRPGANPRMGKDRRIFPHLSVLPDDPMGMFITFRSAMMFKRLPTSAALLTSDQIPPFARRTPTGIRRNLHGSR